MIVEERMRTFINSLDTGNTPFLDELECSALSEGVPIIRKEMQSFIKTLLALAKPQKILEVGTAVGFSTLLMCEYGRPDLHITTIENYEKRSDFYGRSQRSVYSLASGCCKTSCTGRDPDVG